MLLNRITHPMMNKTIGISQTNLEQKCTGPRPGSHKGILENQKGISDHDVLVGKTELPPGKGKNQCPALDIGVGVRALPSDDKSAKFSSITLWYRLL